MSTLFHVGTYSQHAIFHISMILNRWYLDTNIKPDDLLQQHFFISVCNTTQSEDDNIVFKKSITFYHFFYIRVDLYDSQSFEKLTKAIYVKLFGLSKKAVDYAIKADMQHELSDIFKTFIYDI